MEIVTITIIKYIPVKEMGNVYEAFKHIESLHEMMFKGDSKGTSWNSIHGHDNIS